MPDEFFVKELPNGMTLLGERMDHVVSAAVSLLVPVGAAHDPDGCEGAAAVAAEWCLRGAGPRDTRGLHDALDALGCQHHERPQSAHVHFSAAQLGRHLGEVLAIYADIVRRPRLEDAGFESSRGLVAQDLASLEDEPAHKCNLLLGEHFYPRPLGRCVYGSEESLAGMTAEAVRDHVRRSFAPRGTILAAAGNIEWGRLCGQVEELFGDWSAPGAADVATQPPAGGTTHLKKDSAQTHLAMAHRSVPPRHERYYAARLAVTVLSGGMSSRLFTEVREKRGLAYHVSTRYDSLKDHAGLFTYAGTRPEAAQETFDVTVGELRRLGEGVEPHEIERSRTQLKSWLVMRSQSTGARASAIAGDWYHLRRLRSLDEIMGAVDDVTADEVVDYVRAFPAEDFTTLVIGPEPLGGNGAGG